MHKERKQIKPQPHTTNHIITLFLSLSNKSLLLLTCLQTPNFTIPLSPQLFLLLQNTIKHVKISDTMLVRILRQQEIVIVKGNKELELHPHFNITHDPHHSKNNNQQYNTSRLVPPTWMDPSFLSLVHVYSLERLSHVSTSSPILLIYLYPQRTTLRIIPLLLSLWP